MNNWDRDNLKFLLTADEAEFSDWFAQATNEDVNYALSLFAQYRNELVVAEMEIDRKSTRLNSSH